MKHRARWARTEVWYALDRPILIDRGQRISRFKLVHIGDDIDISLGDGTILTLNDKRQLLASTQ